MSNIFDVNDIMYCKKYNINEQVGNGVTSIVYKATDLQGNIVAIKRINITKLQEKTPNAPTLIEREINILKRLNHSNVNKLIETFTEKHNEEEILYLVLEYCDTDLQKLLKSKQIKEGEAKYYTKQIATTFYYLKKNGIAHRDLKPANILIKVENGINIIKIADFGLAKAMRDNDLSNTMAGSPLYMAPEVIFGDSYSNNADLYSIGVILYYILTKSHPFTGTDIPSLVANIKNKTVITFPNSINLSNTCKDLIMKLLQKEPSFRITWDNFFKHEWLGGIEFYNTIVESYNKYIEKNTKSNAFINEDSTDSKFYNACLSIQKLAKQKSSSDALNLYIICCQDTKNYIKYLQLRVSDNSTDLMNCKKIFSDCLFNIKRLHNSNTSLSLNSPDNMIFQYTMKIIEKGAHKELLNLYQTSIDLYNEALCIIFYLRRRPCDTIPLQTLIDCENRIGKRLQILQNKI